MNSLQDMVDIELCFNGVELPLLYKSCKKIPVDCGRETWDGEPAHSLTSIFYSSLSNFSVSLFWCLYRDDRCISDHGREAWFPYLDELVVRFLQSIPLDMVLGMDELEHTL